MWHMKLIFFCLHAFIFKMTFESNGGTLIRGSAGVMSYGTKSFAGRLCLNFSSVLNSVAQYERAGRLRSMSGILARKPERELRRGG